ncbi:MAG: STAS domain-containing protein [Burkholderiales bacterium]|nr:STAS domain-containing protein [Burkholderiales bacterium]
MGIFSLFGKKGQPDEVEAEKDAARRKRESSSSRIGSSSKSSATRTGNAQVQRDAARATAQKIDAIESEMTSELMQARPKPAARSGPPTQPKSPAPVAASKPAAGAATPTAKSANSVLPTMGMSTDFLLGGDSGIGLVEVASSETPPVIEEAAILFANEQTEMVEQMLLGAIHDTSLDKDAVRTVWLMLFDLYQITGKQEQFENLSIDYAAKFETSPPGWDTGRLDPQAATIQPSSSGATPAIAFSGKLDENIVKLLDRAQKSSEKSNVIRLEFSRVTEVLPEGCELLLATLRKLQKAGSELVLVGAPDFANKIRTIVEVGRRDPNDSPWWLWMEILQLLNREKEFEEASIDFCVTYEVSPPAFVPPKNKVTTDIDQAVEPTMETDRFMMPAVVDSRTNVIANVTEFASAHNPAVIDCSRLNRVDFSAAGQLLSALAPLATKGRAVQLQNVNHLVAALFHVMGLRDIASIMPRKN